MKTPRAFALRLQWLAAVLSIFVARADFVPIPLTADSYNQDMIVERTAPPPLIPATTASMDTGVENTGLSWYEKGYNTDSPGSGLPSPGTSTVSEAVGDHEYRLPPSYKTNNVVLIDATLTSGSLGLTTPANYAALSFLVSGGNGGGWVSYQVRHQDATVEQGLLQCRDWNYPVGQAYTAGGRVNVSSFAFDSVGSPNPRLYGVDVPLSNNISPVLAIDFGYAGGSGHNAIFGVSGETNGGVAFCPIAVNGFNADVVVEASATRADFLIGYTTATVENGMLNSQNTWYEQGYFPPAPDTGLPAAGTSIVDAAAPDHQFTLAPSYTNNNAVMIDADQPVAPLVPLTPAAYGALSFLGCAGHGPVTNKCAVLHSDGTGETNTIVLPDWCEAGVPAAQIANGRVNVNRKSIDLEAAHNPRLFAVDMELTDPARPVTNVVLMFVGGAASGHGVILAMSGRTDVAAMRPRLTIQHGPGGAVVITSSAVARLQSTTALAGTNTVWKEEGTISEPVTTQPETNETGRWYRAVE